VKVVILAGGEGKRLRPLTEGTPKPLVKIGGRAIIDYQIDIFRKLGVKEFIVLGGYRNGELQAHFADYQGAEVKVVVEEKPLGTAGAIKAARNEIGAGDFVAVNGDIMTDLDLSPLLSGGGGFLAKIALVPMVSPYGVVKTFGDKVIGFVEKPMLEDVWVNAGFYWLGDKIFDYLPESGSIEKETFPRLAEAGSLGFYSFQIHDRFWRSIDTIKDFEEANQRFARTSGI
jgi:NDP-sugar pyrophosphorylase family protein